MENDVTIVPEGSGRLLAGRYRIVRRLGAGGMGEVYLVEDLRLDGRLFAVKMLPAILAADRRACEQLKAETKTVLGLVHPNIVQVRDFNQNGTSPFLVMDYVEGRSLADVIAEKGRLTEAETVKLLSGVAAALDYAHKKKVVHRDVKPSNVMIGKDGTAYILDFGIAREAKETMTRITGTLASGTLLYMSPEQLDGDAPAPAQDVYSFAAMVYECLSGKPPFFRGDVAGQIKSKPPPPLPGGISIVGGVMAGLAKRPEARPAFCSSVLKQGEAASSRLKQRVSASSRLNKAIPEESSGVGGCFAKLFALAAIAAGAYFGWRFYSDYAAEREQAAEQARQAREEYEKSLKKERERTEEFKRLLEIEREKMRQEKESQISQDEQNPGQNQQNQPEPSAHSVDSASDSVNPVKSEPPPEPVDDQETRQKEVEEIVNLRTWIRIKRQDAGDKMEQVAAFRDDAEGLQAHIDAADAKWRQVEEIPEAPATLAEAKSAFEAISLAETEIATELDWLKTNKPIRDEAKAIDAEIEKDVLPVLVKFKAADYTRKQNAAGIALRKEGQAEFGKSDFANAKKHLEEAKVKLLKAGEDARNFCIATHLKSAKTYLEAKRWQLCVEEADTVLGWDAGNAKAKELKSKAMEHIVPTLLLTAKIGDREVMGAVAVPVGADFGLEQELPVVWDSLVPGENVGAFNVTYTEGGKTYSGVFKGATVDWVGPREVVVQLKEDGEVAAAPSLRDSAPRAAQLRAPPAPGVEKTIVLPPGGVWMDLIYCPPGEFMMGSPEDEAGRGADELQHKVKITKGFWLGKCEVTQAQWASVMGSNPSIIVGDNLPVNNVSYDDCQRFIAKINAAGGALGGRVRLPTEAEWEYACRAQTTGAFENGKIDALLKDFTWVHPEVLLAVGELAWYGANSAMRLHATGYKSANPWGFHDMHGNVAEWCSDWYGSNYYVRVLLNPSLGSDPQGPEEGTTRVIRGGAYDDPANDCRAANRSFSIPSFAAAGIGLRLCVQ